MMHLAVYVIPDFDFVFGSVVDERHGEGVLMFINTQAEIYGIARKSDVTF